MTEQETTKPRVLISDSMSSQAVTIFEERGVEVVQSSKLSESELLDMIGDFDGLAIRSSTRVTEALLERATRLKVVGRAGIGVDNVDVPACTRRGVVVMNTPLGNAITTAEHTMARSGTCYLFVDTTEGCGEVEILREEIAFTAATNWGALKAIYR